ncbi:peroxisomal membrane protein pex14 [Puccinia graminis f. sp. tritici]|uniref:Peroxisomal membrane protein PEX14 n=1 Tax=Puccinia graminis f. sp. tritici TaxID=56615 RepID=A0A5B0MZK3_PUCGR|nr:peroxisomal membrane protein pex14 [Puccinia graminis f. sp. tritici]
MGSLPSNRDSLVSSAVGFLQDPTVASSPLAKRIAFLESKGLTSSEIEEALRRASSLSTSQNAFAAGYRGPYQADRDATDWRDWFVMTVIGGGVGYLLINLAKKFLLPALKPPTQTELEEAQARLEQKYDEVSGILQTIQADTEIVKREITEQTEKLGLAMKEVESAVEECLTGEIKRDQELHSVQQEVEGLRTSVQQMFQSNKEAQTAAIVDLQTELKSLKSLMTARPGPSSNLPASSTNGVSVRSPQTPSGLNSFGIQPQASSLSKFNTTRPVGIPAWQLAPGYNTALANQTSNNGDHSSNQTGSTPTPSASGSSPQTKTLSYSNGNGTGNLDDHNRSGTATPELSSSRQSLVEDDDDHIINSKYTTDSQKQSINEPMKASVDGLLS